MYVYVCMCVCMYIYVHVHIHIHHGYAFISTHIQCGIPPSVSWLLARLTSDDIGPSYILMYTTHIHISQRITSAVPRRAPRTPHDVPIQCPIWAGNNHAHDCFTNWTVMFVLCLCQYHLIFWGPACISSLYVALR